MRVLVLGVTGMLGHKLYQTLSDSEHKVFGTMRRPPAEVPYPDLPGGGHMLEGVDVRTPDTVHRALLDARPQVVINCIGLIKPRSKVSATTIEINSLFPHRLAQWCDLVGARLIHISTDCVFSGRAGNYSEESIPDAEDLYGRTKLLGEVTDPPHLTIRTSIIGRELGTKYCLLEWILSQTGEANGFVNAIFTGLSTRALSRVLLSLLELDQVQGLLHVAGERVNKYDLLKLVVQHFGLNLQVNRYEDIYSDHSLDATAFGQLGLTVPSMEQMVAEMAAENSMYESPVTAVSR